MDHSSRISTTENHCSSSGKNCLIPVCAAKDPFPCDGTVFGVALKRLWSHRAAVCYIWHTHTTTPRQQAVINVPLEESKMGC